MDYYSWTQQRWPSSKKLALIFFTQTQVAYFKGLTMADGDFDCLCDGSQVNVQSLFCRMPLLGFVRRNLRHPCIVPILLFFAKRFIRVPVVQPYNSLDTATARKSSRFIQSERTDFQIIDNLSIAVYPFAKHI